MIDSYFYYSFFLNSYCIYIVANNSSERKIARGGNESRLRHETCNCLVAIYLLTFTHTEDPEYLSKRDDFERSSNSDLSGIDFINKQTDSQIKANEGRYEVNFP